MGIVCSSIGNRLGNQMCNIAAGLSYAEQQGKEFVITTPYSHNLNNSSYTEYKWILDKFKKIPIEETTNFAKIIEGSEQKIVDTSKYNNDENVIFVGTFQSDRYYDKNCIMGVFGNTDEDNERISKKYGDLTDFVSVSVRRGDYLNMGGTFITPSKEWYEKCYKKYFDGRKLLISGDDVEWCKKNITFGRNEVIYLEELDAVETLKIKQCCKRHIIPPSSYSWWSAYLSGDDSIVVAPNIWFSESSNINSENKFVENWIKEKLI